MSFISGKKSPEQMMGIVCGGQYDLLFEDNDMVKLCSKHVFDKDASII